MSDRAQARLAFIGCGGFASASILPCVPLIPEIDLVAVCDVAPGRAEAAARTFGARRHYTDAAAMLAAEELDGVFVIGPAPQQYALAPLVLSRGLPVYVEKPSANTSAEATELAELAAAHGTWGQCGFMKRFAYVYRIARDVTARESFGPVNLVTIKFGQGPYPRIWGIDSYHRAFLIGQCVHLMDLARYLGGDVLEVQATFQEAHGGPDAAEGRCAYLANLRYTSGAVGQINLNCYENQQGFRDIQERAEIFGAGESLHIEDMRTVRYLTATDWSSAVPGTGPFSLNYEPSWTGVINSREQLGYQGEVRHFALRCLGREATGPDLWDSAKALRLGEAIYEAAHGGGTVRV